MYEDNNVVCVINNCTCLLEICNFLFFNLLPDW